jgi:glycerophosphoryl diester phosphodiesterase
MVPLATTATTTTLSIIALSAVVVQLIPSLLFAQALSIVPPQQSGGRRFASSSLASSSAIRIRSTNLPFGQNSYQITSRSVMTTTTTPTTKLAVTAGSTRSDDYAAPSSFSRSFHEALEVVPPADDDVDDPLLSLSNNNKNNVTVIGHRGSIYEHVENTMEGFARCAVELECSIELDIYEVLVAAAPQQDPDADDDVDTLVVFHGGGGGEDQKPGRLHPQILVPDPNRSIMDCTLAEVNALSFNSDYDGYVCPKPHIGSARIPTLRSVLELLQHYPKTQVKLELKAGGPQFITRAMALLAEFPLSFVERCTFSSFHHSLLHEIHARNHQHQNQKNSDSGNTAISNDNNNHNNALYFRTGALFDAPLPDNFTILATGCEEVHLRYDTCTVTNIEAAHRHGYTTLAWFRGPTAMKHDVATRWDNVRGEQDLYTTLWQSGVQQICCNKPQLLLELMTTTTSSSSTAGGDEGEN